MKKKIAIVTGSSSGFGMLSAVELACSGFIVVATMRDVRKSASLLELAKKKHVEEHILLYSLDVPSAESIEEFKTCLQQLPSVDVLVNNAGFARGDPRRPVDEALLLPPFVVRFDLAGEELAHGLPVRLVVVVEVGAFHGFS